MTLEQGIARRDFEVPPAERAAIEEQLADLLQRFPLTAWESMTLEQYALGTEQTRDSYAYALEWGTPKLGSIRGGTSAKHVIFRRRKDATWHYPKRYSNEQEAWFAIRDAFQRMLAAAGEGRWQDAAAIPELATARVVRAKTLWVYHRDELLPIYSKQHLKHFAEQLGLPEVDDNILLNRAVLAALRESVSATEADTVGLARLLYRAIPPADFAEPTWVKIAPGRDAQKWEECRDNNYICVGWDDVGDLTEYETEEEFRAAFGLAYDYEGNASTQTVKARELWTLTSLKPGDKIVANKGTSQVVAVGTVMDEGYRWRPERAEYKHTVAVDWDEALARELDPPEKAWALRTVMVLKPAVVAKIQGQPLPGPKPMPMSDYDAWARLLDRKKQVIFYGPPGTGKTRAALRFSRWWLQNRNSLEAADLELELSSRGFVNQHWQLVTGSEDHIDLRHGVLRLGQKPKGSWRNAAAGDLVLWRRSGVPGGTWLRVVCCHPDDEDPLKLRRLGYVAEPGTPADDSGGGLQWSELPPAVLEQALDAADLSGLSAGDEALELASYLTQVTFHASYGYEDFVEGYRPAPGAEDGLRLTLRDGIMKRIANTALADDTCSYVLLIDEINRANVPRVLGELLTVLESDKRGTVTIELPTSGAAFAMPENVYVIGTMNTADRSIRTLDAALRRRFSFIELQPEPEVLSGSVVDGLDLEHFLTQLNERITEKAGRERRLGHALFLVDSEPVSDAETLAQILRMDVIPLLQELAFEDFGQLVYFLGKALVDVEHKDLTQAVQDDASLIAGLVSEYATATETPST